jgi:hypothetical protein
MKKLLFGIVLVILGISITYACYNTKHCCQRFGSSLSCIEVCVQNACPYDYPYEYRK